MDWFLCPVAFWHLTFFLPGEHLLTGAGVMEKPVGNSLGGKEHPPPLWGSACSYLMSLNKSPYLLQPHKFSLQIRGNNAFLCWLGKNKSIFHYQGAPKGLLHAVREAHLHAVQGILLSVPIHGRFSASFFPLPRTGQIILQWFRLRKNKFCSNFMVQLKVHPCICLREEMQSFMSLMSFLIYLQIML